MAILTMWCPVLRSNITRVADLEGRTTTIICYEYERATGNCRMMKRAEGGGMLSQLLERASENTLQTRDPHCVMR